MQRINALRVLGLLALLSLPSFSQAQTVVTGTFKTPNGLTPQQANIIPIATVSGSAVYGYADFRPINPTGGTPQAIICDGNTYVPIQVRAYVKADGTLMRQNGTAGQPLTPTDGCLPSGVAYQLRLQFGSSAVALGVTITEVKSVPDETTADWADFPSVGGTPVTLNGYRIIQNEGTALTQRTTVNMVGAGVNCVDDSGNSRTNCTISGGGGSGSGLEAVEEVDGSPSVTDTTTLRFDQADGFAVSEASAGIARVDLTLTDAHIPDSITINLANTATALASNPTDCSANQYANAIAASGNLTCASISDADVPDTITIDLAATATALAANPSDCSAGQFAQSIAANGNLTCAAIADSDVPDNITIDLANTATALASNPTDCSANQFATTIAANGNLTCASIADADVPDTITVSNYLPLTGGTLTGNLLIDNQMELRLLEADANGSNYLGLRGNASITSNLTLTLNITGDCGGSNGGALTVQSSEIVCSDDDGGEGGGGDNVTVNTSAASDADFTDSSHIAWTLNTGTTPDQITAAIVADSVGATELADADFGDFTCSDGGGGCLLDADSVSANELDAAGVESELEAVLDLEDLQGAVTDSQVPDTITASNYMPLGSSIQDLIDVIFTDPAELDILCLDDMEQVVNCAPSSEFADDVFRVHDDGDPTKELAFQVSGLTTMTTRTTTVPDANTVLPQSYSCTNQFATALNGTTGATTCTTATLAGAQFANQGTTTTVLHGNASGNPSFGAVVSADLNITTTSCTNQVVTAISSGAVGTCSSVTGAMLTDGTVTPNDVDAKLKTFTATANLETPTTADSYQVRIMNPANAITITRIQCDVKAATSVTINLREVSEGTPRSGGTAVATSDLTCDTDGANTTTFSNAGIAQHAPVVLEITGVSGTPEWLALTVEYTIDN